MDPANGWSRNFLRERGNRARIMLPGPILPSTPHNLLVSNRTIYLSHACLKEIAMGLLDSVKDLLTQYSNGSTDTANAAAHFDQVAQAVDHSTIADGLSAVFRSEQTPA